MDLRYLSLFVICILHNVKFLKTKRYLIQNYKSITTWKQAFEKLDEKLSEKGVCVAVKAKLSKDSGVGKGIDFDHIVEKLQDKPKAKGK